MDNSVNKASVSLWSVVVVMIAAIVTKLLATAKSEVPEGYEDSTGFHFGHPRQRN